MTTRLYVGNLPVGINERELEDEFAQFGRLKSIWVARKPPGFAFVEYEDRRDADDAVRKLNNFNGWIVEYSRRNTGGGGRDRGRDRFVDFGRDGGRGRSPPRYRSPRRSPGRRRSPSLDRDRRRRSPSYDRERDYSRRSRSPRRRSLSPDDRRRRSPTP